MKRIPSLDGLRAISITLVVLGHLGKSGHAPLVFKSYYTDLGVDLFFMISGYLITTILLKEHRLTSTISLRDFYVRRAFRIFPAALVFMSLALIAYWPQFRWYHIVAALLYVSNFDSTRPWIFGQLWSLGVEEQFYVLWPSVLKRWYKHRILILAGVTVLAPVGQALLFFLKIPGGNYGSWPGVASTLAAGCLLGILNPVLPKVGKWTALTMFLVLILIPLFAANSASKTLFQLFVLVPIRHLSMAALLVHVVQMPYRLLNWAPIVWLGRISYSLYLWQQPFCADPKLHSPYLAILAIGFAALSYYCVEKPMLRLRDTQTRRRLGAYYSVSKTESLESA